MRRVVAFVLVRLGIVFVAVQIIAYERLMSQTVEACRLLCASTLQEGLRAWRSGLRALGRNCSDCEGYRAKSRERDRQAPKRQSVLSDSSARAKAIPRSFAKHRLPHGGQSVRWHRSHHSRLKQRSHALCRWPWKWSKPIFNTFSRPSIYLVGATKLHCVLEKGVPMDWRDQRGIKPSTIQGSCATHARLCAPHWADAFYASLSLISRFKCCGVPQCDELVRRL